MDRQASRVARPGIVAAADRHSEIVEKAGGSATVTQPQGLITAVFERSSWALSPMSQAPFGEGMVTFNLTYLKTRSAFTDATVRRER